MFHASNISEGIRGEKLVFVAWAACALRANRSPTRQWNWTVAWYPVFAQVMLVFPPISIHGTVKIDLQTSHGSQLKLLVYHSLIWTIQKSTQRDQKSRRVFHSTSVLKYFQYLSQAPKLSMDDKSHPEKRCKIYCNTGSSTLYFTTPVACAAD